MLVDLLGWKSFAHDDLVQSICMDCIYDAVMFCVNKGFTWTEIRCIINLVLEMMNAAECRYTDSILCQTVQHPTVNSSLTLVLFEYHLILQMIRFG